MVWQSDRVDVGKDGRGRRSSEGGWRCEDAGQAEGVYARVRRPSGGTAMPQTELSEGVDTLITVYSIIQMQV